nr:protein ALP1-like [Onthophagus taurus]
MTTVRTIVKQVCTALWSELKSEYLREPTKEVWEDIARIFQQRANFPNCIGAVDGKHIRIIQPPRSGSLYFNYKKYFSIVLLAIADADYKFIYIDVGAYGKCSDSTIFKDSTLYQKLINKTLQIPEKQPITSIDSTLMPYVFVGDEAFPLTENIMRPYPGTNLSSEKKNV